MNAVYFNRLTGAAFSQVSGPDLAGFPLPRAVDMALMLEGPVILPGYVEGHTYYPLPAQPSRHHVFNYTTKQWKDARTVDDFKAEKSAAIKKIRDATEFSPFTYNGMTFDGDLDAQRRLSVLVSAAKSAIAAGYSFTKDFTLADNTVVQLTAEDFIGIEMAKLWQVDVAFQGYRVKKAAIEAATTLEELEAIPVDSV